MVGDLNLDGQVDLVDFFIFADHFGEKGPPDTLRVVVIDTVQVEQIIDVFDTIVVTAATPQSDACPKAESLPFFFREFWSF